MWYEMTRSLAALVHVAEFRWHRWIVCVLPWAPLAGAWHKPTVVCLSLASRSISTLNHVFLCRHPVSYGRECLFPLSPAVMHFLFFFFLCCFSPLSLFFHASRCSCSLSLLPAPGSVNLPFVKKANVYFKPGTNQPTPTLRTLRRQAQLKRVGWV